MDTTNTCPLCQAPLEGSWCTACGWSELRRKTREQLSALADEAGIPHSYPAPKKCWICEKEYIEEHCPRCGPPEPWGPTTDEMHEQDEYQRRRRGTFSDDSQLRWEWKQWIHGGDDDYL